MNRLRRESGLTLIELSLVLIILGLLGLMGWRLALLIDQKQGLLAAPPLLERAEQALLAFAAIHDRLPCPDQDQDGQEDCGAGEVGTLPWLTLQLGDRQLYPVRYGVYQAGDANLAQASDTFIPLSTPQLPPAISEVPLGNITRLDLCYSLQQAQASGLNTGHLHLLDESGNPAHNLAYTLSIVGETTSSAAAAEYGTTLARAYVEAGWVRAADFSRLYTNLHCSDTLSSAGHSYPNLAVTATIMNQAEEDYQHMLDLLEDLAFANALLAGAGVASSVGGVADGTTEMSWAIAQVIVEAGSTAAAKIPAAAVSIAGSAAATISAATATAFAELARQEAEQIADDFGPVLSDMQQLRQEVVNHAEQADAFELH